MSIEIFRKRALESAWLNDDSDYAYQASKQSPLCPLHGISTSLDRITSSFGSCTDFDQLNYPSSTFCNLLKSKFLSPETHRQSNRFLKANDLRIERIFCKLTLLATFYLEHSAGSLNSIYKRRYMDGGETFTYSSRTLSEYTVLQMAQNFKTDLLPEIFQDFKTALFGNRQFIDRNEFVRKMLEPSMQKYWVSAEIRENVATRIQTKIDMDATFEVDVNDILEDIKQADEESKKETTSPTLRESQEIVQPQDKMLTSSMIST